LERKEKKKKKTIIGKKRIGCIQVVA